MFIDAHCHLDHPYFEDKIKDVVLRASKAGVSKIVTNGIDKHTNRLALGYAEQFEIVDCCLGIFPPDHMKLEAERLGRHFEEFSIDGEITWISKQKFLAVGEVGMDFKGEHDAGMQEELFVKMIKMAKKLDKAVVVHSRKAEKACIELLEKLEAKKVVMHCFSGKKNLVKQIEENKWMMTVPTCVVRSEQFQSLVRNVDINQLLCETDAPFLSPYPGKQNEPSYVVEAYRKIAELKGMVVEEVQKNVFVNYKRFF
jgi:TatD DNase family protein